MPNSGAKLQAVMPDPADPGVPLHQQLDDTDRAILRLLQEDGRLQYGAIARHLGVSDGTVRNRIMQMMDANVFRIFAVADPVKLGYEGYAMLLLRLAAGADPDAIAEHFRELPNVTFVVSTAGQYAMLVEVVIETPQALHEFLKGHCYGRKDIAAVEPLIGLRMYKNAVQWTIPAAPTGG